MHGRQRIDGHVQNARDFRGPRLAVDPELIGTLLTPRFLLISGVNAAMDPRRRR